MIFSLILNAQVPEIEWFKGYGTNTEEQVHEGMQTSDGGYIAIGHGIESSDADDMLIIKVDSDGNFEWKQDFGTAGLEGILLDRDFDSYSISIFFWICSREMPMVSGITRSTHHSHYHYSQIDFNS